MPGTAAHQSIQSEAPTPALPPPLSSLLQTWKEHVATAREQIARFPRNVDDDDDVPDYNDTDEIATWIDAYVRIQYNQALLDLGLAWASVEETVSSSGVSSPPPLKKQKDAILLVRTILRFWFVTLGVARQHRLTVQRLYTQPALLDALGTVVVQRNNEAKGEGVQQHYKSTVVMACRLLTNLVTNNPQTSKQVLQHWKWQPDSYSQQRECLLNENNDAVIHWLDFLLAAATTDRSALAALVIAWYNALQANQEDSATKYIKAITSAPLVISNLIRHALPSQAVLTSSSSSSRNDNKRQNAQDEATEWITMLVCLLCQKGSLANVYQATTGLLSQQYNDKAAAAWQTVVVPEQVLLLQLLHAQVEDSKPEEASHLLGDTIERLEENVRFLAKDLYGAIRQAVLQKKNKPVFDKVSLTLSSSNDETTTATLSRTALSLVRELLAEILVQDTSTTQHLRDMIGKDESIAAIWIQDLAYYFDHVQERFQGRPAKEIVLTQEEQRIFISLVRLLGNLCHSCKVAQNLLRQIKVPLPNISTGEGVQEGSDASSRTGLHLLLSCTSLSHTCFTLREWSVVAIRNALEDNLDNQAVVAELQAQQPAPSAPLAEMGMRVQLGTNGKVSLKPIEEE